MGTQVENVLARVDARIEEYRAAVYAEVTAAIEGGLVSPSTSQVFEERVMACSRALSDGCVSVTLVAVVEEDPTLEVEVLAAARAGLGRLKHVERRTVQVTLLGGSQVALNSPYLRRDLRGRRGPRRGCGRRGPSGNGLYPVLAALGVAYGASPATAAEIVHEVVSSESTRVARSSLARRGLDLGHERVLKLVNHFGKRVVTQLDGWLESWRQRPHRDVRQGPLKGKRVAIAVDGGRARFRVPKPGRCRANGHRGFDTPWVEPKELTIYVLDDDGRREQSFPVVLDGTFGDADALFSRLTAYLKALGAYQAAKLIFLGDGALWIWERVPQLVKAIGIERSKVIEILDHYHAIEKLGTIAALPSWNASQQARWLKHARRMLNAGRVDDVLAKIDKLAKCHPSEPIMEHYGYFERNQRRLRYPVFRRAKYPIGSGAIESAIRRVINLRIKASSKFWLEENAAHMLTMRSYLKAERFNDLFKWSTTTACSWWQEPPDLLEPTRLSQQKPQRRQRAPAMHGLAAA